MNKIDSIKRAVVERAAEILVDRILRPNQNKRVDEKKFKGEDRFGYQSMLSDLLDVYVVQGDLASDLDLDKPSLSQYKRGRFGIGHKVGGRIERLWMNIFLGEDYD